MPWEHRCQTPLTSGQLFCSLIVILRWLWEDQAQCLPTPPSWPEVRVYYYFLTICLSMDFVLTCLIYSIWDMLYFLDLWIHIFHQFYKFYLHYLFTYYFFSTHSLFSSFTTHENYARPFLLFSVPFNIPLTFQSLVSLWYIQGNFWTYFQVQLIVSNLLFNQLV